MTRFEDRLLTALTELDDERSLTPAPALSRHPSRRRRVTILVVAAAATVLSGAAAAVAASVLAGSDFTTSCTAVIGGPMFVKGAGCESGALVAIDLDGVGFAEVRADRSGDFFQGLTLPAGTTPGNHTIGARCGDLLQHAGLTAIETVPLPDPLLEIGGVAAPGNTAFVKGAGCGDGSTVTITVQTVPALTVTTVANEGGSFDTQLVVPREVTPGTYPAEAACAGQRGDLRTTVTVGAETSTD